MKRLDVSAQWELLSQNPIPISEPINEDEDLCLPTERDVPVRRSSGQNKVFLKIRVNQIP